MHNSSILAALFAEEMRSSGMGSGSEFPKFSLRNSHPIWCDTLEQYDAID